MNTITKGMEEQTIHIVYGSTGEYSDYVEWPIIAYEDKAKAQDHAKNVQEYADEWYDHYLHWLHSHCGDRPASGMPKFNTSLDPDPQKGSWGNDPNNYEVHELKLISGTSKWDS